MAVPVLVPFHSHCQEPGPQIYHIEDFYDHSLMSIICKRISNPSYSSQFHYEPYELHWHPPHKKHDMQVYKELYNSEAFIKAHQQLQESPPKPGCDLPRSSLALCFGPIPLTSCHLVTQNFGCYIYILGTNQNIDNINPSVSSAAMLHTFKWWVIASLSSYMLIVFPLKLPDDFKDFAT